MLRPHAAVQITFIFIFWWIIAYVLLGLAGLVVYHAGRRARIWSASDLSVRLSVSLIHLSYVVLLCAAAYLLHFVRGGHDLTRAKDARLFTICLALTAVWVGLSSAAWVTAFRGQAVREAERELQIVQGRVWTEAASLHNEMATVARQVDALSPEEILKKVRP
jgi:hypothetical protein